MRMWVTISWKLEPTRKHKHNLYTGRKIRLVVMLVVISETRYKVFHQFQMQAYNSRQGARKCNYFFLGYQPCKDGTHKQHFGDCLYFRHRGFVWRKTKPHNVFTTKLCSQDTEIRVQNARWGLVTKPWWWTQKWFPEVVTPSQGWSPENTSTRSTVVKISNQTWKELYGSKDIDDDNLAKTCASFDFLKASGNGS